MRAVWALLGEYQGWITTAPQTADPHQLAPFDPKPLLVLTGAAISFPLPLGVTYTYSIDDHNGAVSGVIGGRF